jgi:TRAP-type C4-dicarboxylate transport system substrate-binding protein
MKIFCAVFLATVLVLSSISGWAQTATKPIELKYADWSPPTSGLAKINQKMLDVIVEKSQGRIKITAYFGETLLKNPEMFRGIQAGAADLAEWVVGTTGSAEKLMTVMRLPFQNVTTTEMGTAIFQKLFSTTPELISEYRGIEVFGLRQMPAYHVHTVKKLAHKPEDLKGMKLIAASGWVDYAKAVGAAPVTMGVGDYYLSLERGLVEGVFLHFPASMMFKTLDVCKYHTLVNSSSIPDAIIFNKEKWNSLPPDLQKVVREAIEWRTAEVLKFDYGEEERAIEYAKKRGNTFYAPTPDEMKLWRESAAPLYETWIARYEKEDLPARRVYERLIQLTNEYKK